MKHLLLLLLAALFLLPACKQSAQKDEIALTKLAYPADLHVVKRADWGWKALSDTLPRHQVRFITIHHGGVAFNGDKDVVEYIRNMQDWSRAEKHWIDIPYHWMIDLQGRIYEARPIDFPGDTNTDYDVRGHALINVIGNYEVQKINSRQLQAVVQLSAFLAAKYGIDTSAIRGHKDYTETLCPGKDLYKYLQDKTIRSQVAEELNTLTSRQ